MKNLFTLGAILGFSLSVVSAQSSFFDSLQTLAEDNLGLPYDRNLACGGCIRSKYVYCRDKEDMKKGRAILDRCCQVGDNDCMWNTTKPNQLICSTLDYKVKQEHKDNVELYKDPYVMVQKFCMKR